MRLIQPAQNLIVMNSYISRVCWRAILLDKMLISIIVAFFLDQCMQMNVLIDMELEKIDKTHAALTSANQQLTEALNLYHSLMRNSYPAVNPHVNSAGVVGHSTQPASYYTSYHVPGQSVPNNPSYDSPLPPGATWPPLL